MKHQTGTWADQLLTDVRLHLRDASSRGWLCVVRDGRAAPPAAALLASGLAPEAAQQGWAVHLLLGLDGRSPEMLLDSLASALEGIALGASTSVAPLAPAHAVIKTTRRLGQVLAQLSAAQPRPLLILTLPAEALRSEMRPGLAMLRALVAASGCCWLVIAPATILVGRAGSCGESPFASLFKVYCADDAAPAPRPARDREPQPEAAGAPSLGRSLAPAPSV